MVETRLVVEDRDNERRKALHLTWKEVIEKGLRSAEKTSSKSKSRTVATDPRD